MPKENPDFALEATDVYQLQFYYIKKFLAANEKFVRKNFEDLNVVMCEAEDADKSENPLFAYEQEFWKTMKIFTPTLFQYFSDYLESQNAKPDPLS